jgi:hypothetical protein
MGKNKNGTQYMVVVIVPDIFISKPQFDFFLKDVYDFKTFLFQVPHCYKLLIDAKAFAVSAYTIFDSPPAEV